MKKFLWLCYWRARCMFARRKKIKNITTPLTGKYGCATYSTIIGMDGIPKQEGVVLLGAKQKDRREIEFVPLMYGDSTEEVWNRLQHSII